MAIKIMRIQLLAVLCVMAVGALPTPDQDSVIVAKAENASTSTPAEWASTEGPTPPLKLTDMEVRSEVSLRYARTEVVTRVRNPAPRAQEAAFRILLPQTAFISGFIMILNGKPYKAYVKEKEEAKEIYNQAVSQGIGAAHIATKARDSNHFTVSVNVEPNTEAVFNLTYEELLVRRNGVYNHAINLHPGTLVPKMTVTVHIKEAQKITQLRVPEIRTGNEIDATENDAQNKNAIIKKNNDDREVTVRFTPDLAEQRRLMEVYAEKSKESRRNTHRLYERDNEEEDLRSEGALGQFVVQYDVDRPKSGEILVNDGYFVHFFAPESLPPLYKHVVFVLDTSGSMMERKIDQLREAMQVILGELNAGDYFNIVEFSSGVRVHDLQEADKDEQVASDNIQYSYIESETKPALSPPFRATSENISKARIIVKRLVAGGGTNIASALDIAIDLIQKGVSWSPTPSNSSSQVEPANDDIAGKALSSETNNKEDMKLEPIIIFLTDGDPTVGETNTKRIISRVSEKNYGERKASIFSLAFGEDADRGFLRKLALRGDGFMRHIYEAADAALQLRDFYRQVASPLLAHAQFIYPLGQVKEDSLTKHKFRALYAGGEAVVAGRLTGAELSAPPQLQAFCGVDDGYIRKRFEVSPKLEKKSTGYLPLERLWVYLTIKQLLDEHDADDTDDKNKAPAKKALDLALKYEFVTPLTSLVVVKPNATNAVDAESVDKPDAVPLLLGAPLSASSFSYSPMVAVVGDRGGSFPSFHAFSNQMSASLDTYSNLEEEDFVEISTSYDAVPMTTMAVATSSAAAPASRLEDYRLQEFPWVRPLLAPKTDALLLPINGTIVTLKLATENDTVSISDGAECARATDGAAGVCRYLPRCAAAKPITSDDYPNLYCVLDNGFAGVCCPKQDGKNENHEENKS